MGLFIVDDPADDKIEIGRPYLTDDLIERNRQLTVVHIFLFWVSLQKQFDPFVLAAPRRRFDDIFYLAIRNDQMISVVFGVPFDLRDRLKIIAGLAIDVNAINDMGLLFKKQR